MSRIRWGILGPGGIASTFVADLVGARDQGVDLDVTAVGSRTLATAQKFADEFGIAHAHGSYEALVADATVDAIYIATPHAFHRDQALLAIAAGKHVLIEKPITLNADEAREVYAAAEQAGVIALEAMWTRFLPQNRELRRILRSGAIGDLRLFTGTHAQKLPSDPDHRLNDPALGGGALLDLGVYPVAFALDVLGAPTSVSASGVLSDRGVDRSSGVVLSHDGGATSLIYSALDVALVNSARIDGTDGRIEIDDTFFAPSGFSVYAADGSLVTRYDTDDDGLRGMQFQAIELARLVDEGWSDDAALTPAASIAVMETMDEVRRQLGVVYPGGR